MLLGDVENEESWYGYDAVTGERVWLGPAPAHLFYAAESKEEAMIMAAKLCIRPADTPQGRAIKLTNYVSLYKKFYGADKLPPDLHLYVRTEADIPVPYREEILRYLKEVAWEERPFTSNPTLLEDIVEVYRHRREVR